MRYEILGPVEVRNGDGPVRLAQGKQRLLLAVLVLHANEVLSRDLLIDALWGESPPPAATGSLHNLVSSLRRTLGDGALITRGRGYVLRVADGELDARRFEALVAQGRAALAVDDAAGAAALLREGLGLWRGPPLADLAYEPAVQGEAARLEELRLAALEERIDAELALGRHAALAPELSALVAAEPQRERLREQRILALYRSGRQAEALAVYSETRRWFVDELGIEPGPALRRLERAVLEQDPALGAPDRLPRFTAAAADHRRALALLAGAIVLVAAAGVLMRGGGQRARTSHPVAVAGDSVAAIDPRTNRVVADFTVGGTPTSVAAGAGGVWVLNADDQTIARVDPRSRTVRTLAIGATPTDLAAARDGLWVGSGVGEYGATGVELLGADDLLERAHADLPAQRHQGAPGLPGQLAVGRDAVWALNGSGDLARIDPRTGRVTATVPSLQARAIALGAGALWALAADDATLVRVDPRASTAGARLKIPAVRLDALAAGAGAVWAVDAYDGTLWRIERGATPRRHAIPVGIGADGVTVGAGAVWVINSLRGTLTRVDPRRDRVTATIRLGNTPRDVVVGEGAVWATVAGSARPLPAAVAGSGGLPALPRPACGRVFAAAGPAPQYLIASDFPLRAGTQQLATAVAFVLRQHRFRAGRFRIGYQSCDASTADSVQSDPSKCAANAKAYAADRSVLGVVGPYNSACAFVEIPILDRAPGGPLAVVSPTTSDIGLTHVDPVAPHGALARLYPAGVRNFARVTPANDAEAAAGAVLARRLGLHRLYVLDDGSDPSRQEWALPFRRSARTLGVHVVGAASWHATGAGFRRLAARVRRARPDGVYLSGLVGFRGGPLVALLRRRLGAGVTLLAPNLMAPVPFLWDTSHGAAKGMYVSGLALPVARLAPRGRAFVRDFRATQPGAPIYPEAVYAAAATEVLLAAIARSDGTRASVAHALLTTRAPDGVLGRLAFDRDGDLQAPKVTIMRVQRRSAVATSFAGATIDRVIVPPAESIR